MLDIYYLLRVLMGWFIFVLKMYIIIYLPTMQYTSGLQTGPQGSTSIHTQLGWHKNVDRLGGPHDWLKDHSRRSYKWFFRGSVVKAAVLNRTADGQTSI